MNEKQAKEAGYMHHGAYSSNQEEMRIRRDELKALGNKAVMVPVKANPYSRGQNTGIVGYAIWWIESNKNRQQRLLSSEMAKRVSLTIEKVRLMERIAEIEKDYQSSLDRTTQIMNLVEA